VFGIEGISTTVTTACSASAAAIGLASDLIACGMLDAALAGGSDTFSPTTLAGFDGLKATCETYCAPFSKPFGLNLGEGSGFVVLESRDRAAKRGAAAYAEVLGYGMSNDAYHCSAPDPSGRGQATAMRTACMRAGIPPEKIPYVNAHGTGTAANDKAETKAVVRVFGPAAQSLRMSSTKSIIGHCLGAAGCIEILAGIAGAQRGVFPPTANFAGAREGCTLDYVFDAGTRWEGSRVFMSNSFAFGGNNVSVIVIAGPEESSAGSRREPRVAGPVCITTCGVVSAAGLGMRALADAVQTGRTCAERMQWGGTFIETAAVPSFTERDVDRRLDFRSMDRPSRFAVAAAKEALNNAGYSQKAGGLAELGFYLCLSNTPSRPETDHIEALFRNRFQLSQVQAFPYIVPNSIAGNVARALILTGHNTVLCGGPGSSLLGLGLAAKAIENGHVDACLCGAVDEISERIMLDNISAGIAAPGHAPVPAEGACMIMLESGEYAEKQGHRTLATVCSMAFSTDTAFPDTPDDKPRLFINTLREALERAGIGPSEISTICRGKENPLEMQALETVFGPLGARVADISGVTGAAECSQPLMNLAYLLDNASVEPSARKNYILASFLSPQGSNYAIIIKRAE
jgi:3-oxoacyl-[acyl-carrier-protein] synthase II